MVEIKDNDFNADKPSFEVKFKERGKRNPKRFYTEEFYRNQIRAAKTAEITLNQEVRENFKEVARKAGEITGGKEEISNIDPLTQLPNRRYFEESAKDRMAEIKRYKKKIPLFFGYLDLDNLKTLNDERGHKAGDKLLRVFGQLLKINLKREEDVCARLGGDEFGVMMFASDLSKVELVVENLKKEMQILIDEQFRGLTKPLGLSVGVEEWDGIKDVKQIMDMADQKLYKEKREKNG